jgi:hypothetical protein
MVVRMGQGFAGGTAMVIALGATAANAATVNLSLVDSVIGWPNPGPIAVNLTEVGTVDWRDFATGDRKAGGTRISDYSVVGTLNSETATNLGIATTFTDGTPVAERTDNKDTRFVLIAENQGVTRPGMEFTVDAGPTSETLFVYAAGWNARTELIVTLGGETQTLSFDAAVNPDSGENHFGAAFRIDFSSAAPETMTVRLGLLDFADQPSEWSNAGIKAVALIPEPASLALLGLGGLMVLGRRRPAARA